jgi:hypothetical protein
MSVIKNVGSRRLVKGFSINNAGRLFEEQPSGLRHFLGLFREVLPMVDD